MQTVYEYLNSVLVSGDTELISKVFSEARQKYSSQFGDRNCESILVNLNQLNSTIWQLNQNIISREDAKVTISKVVYSLSYCVKNSPRLQNLYNEESSSVAQVSTETNYPAPTITVINTYLRKLQDFIDPAGERTYLDPKAVRNVFIPILNWYNQVTGNCFPTHPYLNGDFPSAEAAKNLVQVVIIPYLEETQRALVQTETTVRPSHYISEFKREISASVRRLLLQKAADLMELEDNLFITNFLSTASDFQLFNLASINAVLNKYEK